jgi:hypothetical protein
MTPVPICQRNTTTFTAHFLLNASRSLAISRLEYFILLLAGYAKMVWSSRGSHSIPAHVIEMKNMNRGVRQDELSETIARAIWEGGKAIMGTDGSVHATRPCCYLLATCL